MKRILAIFLLIVLLLSFSSCGSVFFENYNYDTNYGSLKADFKGYKTEWKVKYGIVYDYEWQGIVGDLRVFLNDDYKIRRIVFSAPSLSANDSDQNTLINQAQTIRNYLIKHYGAPNETTEKEDTWFFGEYTISFEHYYDYKNTYSIIIAKDM